MNRAFVLDRLRATARKPEGNEVNMPEFLHLLKSELPRLQLIERAQQEFAAMKSITADMESGTIPTTIDIIARLQTRCLLLVAIGYACIWCLKENGNHEGLTLVEMDWVVKQALGPVITVDTP